MIKLKGENMFVARRGDEKVESAVVVAMSAFLEAAVCLSLVPECMDVSVAEQARGRRMSSLSSASQLQYLLQWVSEFSELQREDFLSVVAAAACPERLAAAVSALGSRDKPVSLFQCRMKLFHEWYPSWSVEERARLRDSLGEAPELSEAPQQVADPEPDVEEGAEESPVEGASQLVTSCILTN